MIAITANPTARPPTPIYQPGARCPCCWHGAWNIGRNAAECARCGLPALLPDARHGR